MVQAPGASALVGVSGAPVPVENQREAERVAACGGCGPRDLELTTKPTLEIIYGIDFESYNSISPGFRFLSGGSFQGPNDVIVDDYFAGANHAKVGSTVKILGPRFPRCRHCGAWKGRAQVYPAHNHAGFNWRP